MNTKMSVCAKRVIAVAVASWMFAGLVTAAENAGAAPAAKSTHLSYAATEVLKLSRAKVGDETIVAYIKQTSSPYDLNAEDIVYLRAEGVTDRVVSAMLTARPDVAAASAVATTAPPAPAPVQAPASTASAPAPGQTVYPGGASQAATTTTVVQPAVTYVQPAPTVVYTTPVVTEYYGGPYYYGYPYHYGWRPGISVSLGFGGRFHGGGWHVGVPVYRGGFHHR